MRITKYFLITAFSLIFANFSTAADLKIGYVDIAYILNESPAAKAAQKKLEQEFTPRNKQLEAAITNNPDKVDVYKRNISIFLFLVEISINGFTNKTKKF